MKFALRILTAALLISTAFSAGSALAACSNPTGIEAQIIHNETSGVPQYCDDTNWISMTGGDPDTCPNGQTSCGGSPNERVVFVTQSTTPPRTYGGISGADTICQSEADAAGLNGKYLVWLSDDTTDPATRFEQSALPYVLTTGTKVADDWSDLTDGTINFNISRHADGSLRSSFNSVATNTNADGTVFSTSDHCANYTANTGNIARGTPDQTSSTWSYNPASTSACNNVTRLYCFEQAPVELTKIVPSGLVAHWRLDETSGTTIFDSSGNGYDGTITNFTLPDTTSNGIIDKGIAFSGSNTRIESPTGFPTGANQPFSISMWVNPDQDTQDGTFFFTDGASNEMVMRTDGNSGALSFSLPNNTVFTGAFQLRENFGKWTLITATSDGTTMNLYKDSVLIDTEALSTYTLTATSFGVGDRHGGSSNEAKDGIYDDVRLYNRAITADEVAEIYAAKDGIRYNASHRTPEYFDGNQFVSLRPDFTEVDKDVILEIPVSGCTAIGDVCDDGSVYAGLSPDGNIPMFTTPSDTGSGLCWNNCNATGTVLVSGIVSSGSASTQAIVATDSDSITAGIQIHQAADNCDNLTDHGQTDWYLPGVNELEILYDNRLAIGNFNEVTNVFYWSAGQGSSSENGGFLRFDSGTDGNRNKTNTHQVRCVRKQNYNAVTAGLVGHWKLDETTGTTATDSSVNGNDGSILNSYTLSSPGAVGQSISLINEGTIQVATTTGITNLEQASFSIWFKVDIDENTSQHLFDKNGDYNLHVNTAQNNFSFTWNLWTTNGEWETASDSIPTYDQWHNVIITYDADDVSNAPNFYLNGALLSSSTSTTPVAPRVENSTTRLNIGNQNNSGSPINGKIDDFRIYDRVLTAAEASQLYAMGTPVGTSTALPQGCPNIGDICDDGTVYAGIGPDGDELYTTLDNGPNDRITWNNGNSSGLVAVGASSTTDGLANTQLIVQTDADSVTADFQTHEAAQYCWDLVQDGLDDWYLPAFDELGVLQTSRTLIPNLNELVVSDGSIYWWSSSEGTSSPSENARARRMFDAFGQDETKYTAFNQRYVRCVRKGPAPRCANPYGIEGQMIYNSTNDIVQYCDGARWIALGKDG